MRHPRSFVFVLAGAAALAMACNNRTSREDRAARTGTPETSPVAGEPEHRDVAMVRVVDTVPNSDAIDVFADDMKAFDGVRYKTVTEYQQMPTKRYTFRIRKAGDNAASALAENSEGLSADGHYTVLVLPAEKAGEPATLKIVTDEKNVDPGKTKLRVVNASPDAGKVKVVTGAKNDTLVDAAPVTVSDYKQVDTVGPLQVRADDRTARVMASVPAKDVEVGAANTILVLGRKAGSPKVEAMVISDHPSAMAAGPDHRATPTE